MFRARIPSIFITSLQNATPATEFAPCRHLTQHWQCDLQKTRNTTRLKYCASHAKWRWTRPKNASSENVAKVLRLPHKTTFDTLQNTSECHEVPHLPRETKQPHMWNLQKWPLLQKLTIGTAIRGSRGRLWTVANGCGRLRTVADGCGRLRTVADGCEHKRNVERTHPQPPDPQSETGTLATHSRKMLPFLWGGHNPADAVSVWCRLCVTSSWDLALNGH